MAKEETEIGLGLRKRNRKDDGWPSEEKDPRNNHPSSIFSFLLLVPVLIPSIFSWLSFFRLFFFYKKKKLLREYVNGGRFQLRSLGFPSLVPFLPSLPAQRRDRRGNLLENYK